ncbi:hypothetical protein [Methylobacterium sp. Leaf85]|uniref:hypothetical protein n=1 Tax=Methylobacterium sp. Leaf85 TaxID=1736241 RepID=UPI0006FEC9EF|nr:hypothetical protein [Methylobacterium sp. Leaf85]KQO50376.1 hypothetical protein ASF08_22580 [Methylobacterium sp. Leaf85]
MSPASEIVLDLRATHAREQDPAGDGETINLGFVTVGGEKGELIYVGRDACMRSDRGIVPLEKEPYNLALAERVDELAGAVWGDDWSRALAELAGINRRTTARDRIRKFGLPPALLYGLVKLSERHDAREISAVARAVARYWDVHRDMPLDEPLIGLLDLLRDFRGINAFGYWTKLSDVEDLLGTPD